MAREKVSDGSVAAVARARVSAPPREEVTAVMQCAAAVALERVSVLPREAVTVLMQCSCSGA